MKTDQTVARHIVGITIGDPAGIGPEICVRAFLARDLQQKIPMLFFGDSVILEQAILLLNRRIDFRRINDLSEFRFDSKELQYIDCGQMQTYASMGVKNTNCGQAAFQYIKTAIDRAMRNQIGSIATAPINKESLKLAQVPYLDHTEMLAKLTASPEPMTLFIAGQLRVFFLTRHLSLAQVPTAIRQIDISQFLATCDVYLKQLGITQPKIAVAALNPHGGEHGLFGTEETDILAPAVTSARRRGLDVVGPIPADAVFHLALEGQYDAVLSLYHDQGHIATKIHDFYRTISFTMGLPFLRTSVDHGTAFEIAGKGKANPGSMIEAIRAAYFYGPQLRKIIRRQDN